MLSKFMGKQLARLKFGKEYSNIGSQGVQTISLIVIALASIGFIISIEMYISLFLGFLFFCWFIGYIVDKFKIRNYDLQQTIRGNTEGTKELWENVIIPLLKTLLEDYKGKT